ncbi:FAD/NAD(P)-binding protein [Syntrophomonas wolfei]|uniref:Oxidoreductase FAD/NAD(P)-binding n=1 Tax=Syntrophomonas wolfei subsp. wolfei (strain DSM 2245B / Goettingen) TaxID=335541 RepID=Q0AZW4_SYNWW|nr:FAD/NAD(P)-binding protein [Syntrophomonas wolfei]ABI67740.1 oxidoreductase FAD/NAD(P)-binding [Syntrophomonas wolfei subsp. wolfei str. Goettingen G311]
MHNCNCENPLVPQIVEIVKIIDETPDVKTFHVRNENGVPFDVRPGQLAMVSLLPVGEGMFSVSWQEEKEHLQFAIRRVGLMTDELHSVGVGHKIGVRGPYGNGFPVEACQGKDMLFIAGGIGLAPLRSFIKYCLKHRSDYGKIQVLYGARSYADLCFKDELFDLWPKEKDTEVFTTLDRPEEGWDGHVGLIPSYLEELNPAPEGKVAVICGPPIMIKFALKSLEKMGYNDEQVITTLEMRMKCGIGKCGRCNIGSEYICLDGPVFNLAQLRKLPPEW